ncbi:MAG: fluoride efflux transporter CrcB [Chitinophagaceae bacterium]|nr:fluoride efflux transporter CrcB [Chitinophagaceae bacterium]
MKNILLVGIGGGAGSIARYLFQKWVNNFYFHSFPLATFLINIIGCFSIGIFYAATEKTNILSPQLRLLLITGLCGGFTTFSTFSFENMHLIRTGDLVYFLLYSLGSVIIGIATVFTGIFLIKAI